MTNDASPEMEEYFQELKQNSREAHDIAQRARKTGVDPEDYVEVKLAENLAERVVGLISSVAPQLEGSEAIPRIQELEEKYSALDWRVAMIIAHEIAQEKFCDFEDELEAMEVGIRTGFAYITLGVVSAPLEGFTSLEIKKTRAGEDYFCLNYAGPVRAAGGTAASVSVLIADYVRKHMGYAKYDPTKKEILRCHAELEDYHNYVANLQYYPSKPESEFMLEHCPVEINGDASEKYEVSNARLKEIDRIGTKRLRSGYCLIHSSCLPLKSPKMWKRLEKWGHDMGMEQWDFTEEFLEIQKEQKSKGGKGSGEQEEKGLKPNYTFVKDLVGGRPVFGHPMQTGGFRLRYGRSRASGLSAQSVHPATMVVTNDFLAIGTQLKVERPGKAAAFSSCDTIEGPIVKCNDGEVLQLESAEQARKKQPFIEEILFLGDTLVDYGDFVDRAHKLVPTGYTPERWALELKEHIENNEETLDAFISQLRLDQSFKESVEHPTKNKPGYEDALTVAKKTSLSLHPAYTVFYEAATSQDIHTLHNALQKTKSVKNNLVFRNGDVKAVLEKIGLPHSVMKDKFIVVKQPFGKALIETLKPSKPLMSIDDIDDLGISKALSKHAGFSVRDKCGTFIGARMGRPEKAKMRTLTGSPHTLFPVGQEGGRLRSFNAALSNGRITSSFQLYKDQDGNTTPLRVSPKTGKKNQLITYEEENYEGEKIEKNYTWTSIDVNELFDELKDAYDIRVLPDLIKGVRGTTNKDHVAEHPLKGILRSKHGVSVNKDGTVRYDCSELSLTHFKPKEIQVTPEKLRELGYNKDIHGNPLKSEDQVCELKPQDIVIPCCDDALDAPSDEIMMKTCNFIDDALQTLYGEEPYYNIENREDLVGKLIVGLAPHTSAGILGRIIGFHEGQTFSAHPYMHAAMRRDCDGDETCFVLLLDAFLNFSKKYLPTSRGSTMDAPLVLTSRLLPKEVDDQIFNLGTQYEYPLELYRAGDEFKKPWDVDIERIEDRIDTPEQYEDIGFTHDTENMNDGVTISSYKTLPSMDEKVETQMNLAVKIRAVDQADVAKLMINKHFIRDTKGNLRKFSYQTFRCVHCNEKYRRAPLSGKCEECGGKVIFTISEGGITKYMDLSLELAHKYDIEPYTKQVLELTQERIEGVFGREMEVQTGLDEWL